MQVLPFDINVALLLFSFMAVIINVKGNENPYCGSSNEHTMCLYKDDTLGSACGDAAPYTITDEQKANAIKELNALRSKVALGNNPAGKTSGYKLPSAANMHAVVWDDEMATIAQRWANQCIKGHDSVSSVLTDRFVLGRRSQNVWRGDVKNEDVKNWTPNWAHIFNNDWFQEYHFITRNHFENGYDSSVERGVGHTEALLYGPMTGFGCGLMVWKTSDDFHLSQVICNIGYPSKNPDDLAFYVAGEPASKCMKGYEGDSTTGLCVKSSALPSTEVVKPEEQEIPTQE